MKLRLVCSGLLLSVLVGCTALAPQTASPLPTLYPPEYLPTVIALTAAADASAMTETAVAGLPTEIPLEPTITPLPTRSPTPAPTLTATTIPGHKQAAILLQAPGPMSKVVSPINLRMTVITGRSERIQVDLFGEDGRLLARTTKQVRTSNEGVLQIIKIPFEIRAIAEVGRITVSTQDQEGRLQSLNSVRVVLLSSGSNEINPAGNPSEPVAVFSPRKNEAGADGVLTVKGDLWPFSLQPVILELIGPDGKSLALRILTVDKAEPQLFETTLPYKVSEPTTARLTIRQDDDRMDGLFYLYSQEVLLNP